MRYLLLLICLLHAKLPEKVVICGIARDCDARIVPAMHIVEKIGELFEDYRVILYENDSRDQTPKLMRDYCQSRTKFRLISEKATFEGVTNWTLRRTPWRIEAIARARNRVLHEAMQLKEYPYLIMVDMDFRLEPSYEGIVEAFTTERAWDALFAYGIDPDQKFWDWFALRDCNYPIGPELMGRYWWKMSKALTLDKWHRVYSAFGGCGIYKKKALEGCVYSANVTPELGALYNKVIQALPNHPCIEYYKSLGYSALIKPKGRMTKPYLGIDLGDGLVWRLNSGALYYPGVCEHVTLHAQMIANGYDKLYINPRMRFHYN
ncbi:MAG: glycosyltransferase [Simkaniaceae bacterium]|nr:glycosyltransferase [Simkaniaceae bacterium]